MFPSQRSRSPSIPVPKGPYPKELVIHSWGAGSFPGDLEERKEAHWEGGSREGAWWNGSCALSLLPLSKRKEEREINLKDGASAKKLIPSPKGTKIVFIYPGLWH